MSIGLGQILLIVLIFLLLFGSSRISSLMRDLGLGVREFKKGLEGVFDEETSKKQRKRSKNNKSSVAKKVVKKK